MSLQVRNLDYQIGGKSILEQICLEVKDGEFVGLIGPNGCGKSTLLKNIYRSYKPDRDTIFLNEKDVLDFSFKKMAAEMAVMAQENHVEFDFEVRDMVMFGRYAKKKFLEGDSATDKKLCEKCLREVGLTGYEHRSYLSLSGGEKQRVLLAKALCQEPEILILDEPTSYLDVKYKLEFLSMLQKMTRKKKIGVLMSLHELDLAERVSDKIVCVKGENIEHYGTPEEVFTDGFVDQLYEITDGTFQEKSGCVELKKCGGIPEVFVIAGNGTGSFLFRQLQRNGIPFAVGILGKNDIDYPAAEALAVQVIAAEAYQDFERQHYEAAKQVMCACRKVICCQTVFGSQNGLNRQLLQEAEDCGMEIELWQK